MQTAYAPLAITYPSLTRRMASWLYEGVLIFGVLFLPAYLFGSLSQTRHALDNRLALQIFLFITTGIYFAWFWHKGQTLAMKTWHLRVVDVQGQALSQLRALARYALCWLWFVPPLAVSLFFNLKPGAVAATLIAWILIYAGLTRLHPKRQFVHDALAGTQLISHAPMSK